MSYEEQLLKLPDYTIAFLSDTCCVITKDIDKALSYEHMFRIDPILLVKNSRSSIGLNNFYLSYKNKVLTLQLKDRRYTLEQLVEMAYDFNLVNLKTTKKYLIYSKGENIFISLPKGDYTYLNRQNVVLKKYLGNMIYFRNSTKEEVLEKCKGISKLEIPLSNIVLDYKVITSEELNGIGVTYQNDLSTSNPFYFVDQKMIKIKNTGAKPIFTYGFSKNNTLNYFDICNCDSYENFKQYLSFDLNYNKNYFENYTPKESSSEFWCRLLQFNIFLPVLLLDNYIKETFEDNIYSNTIIKYTKLRHRLIPFLYSVFKKQRLNGTPVYVQNGEQITIGGQFLIAPITEGIDSLISHNCASIHLDDIYYDFQTEEKFMVDTIIDFFSIDKMPLYVKAGSIIPLAILNGSNDYEILVYPSGSSEFVLHFDEYKSNDAIRHASTTFKVDYEDNKMILTINPSLIKEYAPSVYHFSFVNLKKNSNVVVRGSDFNVEYNNNKKYILVDIYNTLDVVEIEITNEFGLEVSRSNEFLEYKLSSFFGKIQCNEKEKLLAKYKVRPYLHENLESITSRIDKHIKFINKKHKKSLYKMISMYKK